MSVNDSLRSVNDSGWVLDMGVAGFTHLEIILCCINDMVKYAN